MKAIMSWGRMKQVEKQLKAEVKTMLAEAEAVDAEEDARYGSTKTGRELPAELQRRQTRLAKIRQARKALQQRARDKAAAQGKPPDEVISDPESRIMKGGDGFVQAYNGKRRWNQAVS